jgi:hypothetical protein
MTRLLRVLPLLAGLFFLAGCRKPAEPVNGGPVQPPWFEDATDEVGLRFTHDPGPIDGRYFLPQIIGSGAALFDFDGDGRLDLYLIHNGGPKGRRNQLFRQQPDGTFKDVSAGSGLDVAGYGMGAAAGDVNNDGRPDLLLTEYGRIRLFLNPGGGQFTDATGEAGLNNPGWATSAAFLDYDRDGWLDLVVVNYLSYDPTWPCRSASGQLDYCAPRAFQGTATRLFRNLGGEKGAAKAGVRFKDVSLESGLGLRSGPGLGVVAADFTGDGWPDVFVANDGAANHLWVNRKDGTFSEEAVRRGCAVNAMGRAEGNMGIGWGDVDGDGLQDLFVTHLSSETNTLWRQEAPGYFGDWTSTSGMHRPERRLTGFGTVPGDFDNDGALDAAVANGAVRRARPSQPGSPLGPFWSCYGEPNQLFRNDGTGRFRDVSASNPALYGRDNMGRGLAVGDLRNDGSLRLVVTAIGERARVYRNVAANRGHWVRTAHAGGSYLCSSDPRAHFGLGPVKHVDRVEVRWPDGSAEEFPGSPAGRYVTLTRGKGKPLRGRAD